MKKVIYMDHAATTKMARQVSEAMEVFKERIYGNPSSVHMQGTASRERVQLAREDIMKTLGATQGNVFFTSGGTESDNWVIRALGENTFPCVAPNVFIISSLASCTLSRLAVPCI